MTRLLWLPAVLRSAGVDVYVMPGAEQRGRSDIAVRGIVWHHTATGPNWSDGHVAFLLRDGRRDLDGPLAQVGIERDGTWVIVALGRANHNGYGTWGNDAIGLEFYNSGLGEPWPAVQVESGVVGTAAICAHLGIRPAMQVRGHRETDPKRKIDPAGLDMAEVRRRIDARLHTPTTPPPPVKPLPQEADEMIREWHEVYLGASTDPATWSKDMRASYAWHTDSELAGRSLRAIHNDFVATAKAAKRL